MKLYKILAVALVFSLPASYASALSIQGKPILSDGTNAQTIVTQGGVKKLNLCGETYWIPNNDAFSKYKRMYPRLKDNGGYIYYHTKNSSKRYYPCGWGRYEHLSGKVQ